MNPILLHYKQECSRTAPSRPSINRNGAPLLAPIEMDTVELLANVFLMKPVADYFEGSIAIELYIVAGQIRNSL